MFKYVVTGGAGFIGSNFVHYLLDKYPDCKVLIIDKLTYAGNLDNLRLVENNPHYQFAAVDIADSEKIEQLFAQFKPDFVVNFAAESHNDRGVLDPQVFLRTNVLGTQVLLEASKKNNVKRFHHISTCEVYGDLALDDPTSFKETDPFLPRTPYNASKAAANHVVRSYFETFNLPVTISHCGNNYGPYQHPEKVLPLFTTNALEDKELPLFRSSLNRREWIHVLDHCAAVDLIIHWGTPGESYNIGTGVEKNIEEIAHLVLTHLQKPASLKRYVEDRKGHDRRYLLDCSKIKKELNWQPQIPFEEGIKDTIDWYVKNKEWWKKIKDSERFCKYYQNYYRQLGLVLNEETKETKDKNEGEPMEIFASDEMIKNNNSNENLELKGVVLAGGKGTRLYPLTKVTNKHLLPVGKEPMIFNPIHKLIEAGIKQILIVSSTDQMGAIVNLLGSGKEFDCEFTYRVQEEAAGIADALRLAENFAGGSKIVVILGDNITPVSIKKHVDNFKNQSQGAKVLLKKVDDPQRYGVATVLRDERQVIEIEEKPKNPKSNYAVIGYYMYDHTVFDIIRKMKLSERGEYEITEVNNEYLKRKQLTYDILEGDWIDAGTFESLTRANQMVLGMENEFRK